MKVRFVGAAVCLLAAGVCSVSAQVSTTGKLDPGAPDPVVVTVTASPIPLSAAPASVTVITREEIEARLVENSADLLRQIPHISLNQTGPRGSLTTATLRGGDANFTLVLID